MTHTQDDFLVDAILCNQALAETKETLALTRDAILIALNIVGYDVASMTGFEQASALLDMAQELAAMSSVRNYIGQHREIKELDIDKGESMRE